MRDDIDREMGDTWEYADEPGVIYNKDGPIDVRPVNTQEWEYADDKKPSMVNVPRLVNGQILTERAPPPSAVDRFNRSFNNSAQQGLFGALSRKYYDWTDYGQDHLRKLHPDWTDEQIEQRADAVLSKVDKSLREDLSKATEVDPSFDWSKPLDSLADPSKWFPALAGSLAGSMDPTAVINPAQGILRNMAIQGGLSAGVDAGTQAMDVNDDVKERFSFLQMAEQGLFGAATQGAFEGVGLIARKLMSPKAVEVDMPELVEFDTNPYLEAREDGLVYDNRSGKPAEVEGYVEGKLAGGAYEAAAKAGTVDEIMASLEGTSHSVDRAEVEAFVANRDKLLTEAAKEDGVFPPVDEVIEVNIDKNTGKLIPDEAPAAPTAATANDNVPDLVLGEEFRVPTPRQDRAPAIQEHVEKLTKGWKNAPVINVAERLDDLPADVRQSIIDDGAQDAFGFYDEDGQVHIISENVKDSADLSAAIFHESLGHHGLNQKFQNRLDGLLEMMYKGNESVRNAADDYRKDYPGAYDDDVSPIARAVEEVLAGRSEAGKVDASVYQKVKAFVKQWVRERGLDLNVTDKEVQAILAMAHNKVVKGDKESVSNPGRRYMTTWHGSAADFDKFDHSKMGSGEGRQVFGWGTYLTDTRRIGEHYKDMIGGVKPSWAGVEGAYYNVRENMARDVRNAGLKDEVAQRVFDKFSATHKLPTPEELKLKPADQKTYDFVADKLQMGGQGKLYEVELPDEAKFLDYDKPFTQQDPHIQKTLVDAGWTKEELEGKTGGEVYKLLADELGSDKAASKFLAEEGVAGTKFLDGLSRKAGDGSYNYVVYDDNIPKIRNKYMRPSPHKAGPINLDRINTTEDIKDSLRENAYGRPTEVQTHEATTEMARRQGMSVGELMKLAPNFNAVKAVQARDLLASASKRTDRLMKMMNEGKNTDRIRAEFMQATIQEMAIFDQVAGLTTEAGRLLNSFKIDAEARNSRGGKLKYMMDNLPEHMNTPEKIDEIAQLLQKHENDPKAKAALKRKLMDPTTGDYIRSAWVNGLLSDPGTQTTNILGQLGALGLDIGDVAVGATLGQFKRFTGGERVPMREIGSRLYGLGGALKLWSSYFDENSGMTRYRIGDTWANSGNAFVKGGRDLTARTGHKGFTFKGKAGVIETPVRLLAMTDEFFRNVITSMNTYGLTMRQAVNEGHTGEALADRLSELRETLPNDILKEAADATKTLQFLDDPSAITKGWNNLNRRRATDTKLTAARKVSMQALAPFVNTLDGITRMSLRYSPLGVFDRYNLADLKAGGARRDIALGKLAIGTTLATYIVAKALEGDITGDGPSNYAKREELVAGGKWKPNSIKIGDKYVSIKGLDPLALNVRVLANMAEKIKYDKTPEGLKDVGDMTANVVRSLITSLADANFTQGLFTFIGGLEDGEMAESKFNNWAAGMVGSLTPAVVRKNSNDEAIRNTTGDGSFLSRVGGRLQSGLPDFLPWVDGAKDLPQRYDVYGRPRTRDETVGSPVFSRIEVSKGEEDPVVNELQRLASDSKTLIGPVARKDLYTAITKAEGGLRPIEADELETYQYLAGTYVLEKAREIMATDEYKAMDDEARFKLIKKESSKMRKAAREALYPVPEEGEEPAQEKVEWEYVD